MIVSYGTFGGDVATQAAGKTAKLKGKSAAASLESGFTIPVGRWIIQPQAQVVYQRLKFNDVWSNNQGSGFAVALGTMGQVTVRAGSELRKVFTTAAGAVIQGYGRVHVVHTVNDGHTVRLGGLPFELGRMGTALETGLGLDATLAGGATTVYAELTRQSRIGSAGYQGWISNLGVRINF